MGLYSGGFMIGRICASEIWGAYFREGLLSEFYGMSNLKNRLILNNKTEALYGWLQTSIRRLFFNNRRKSSIFG